VAATRTGGVGEVVIDGQTGLLVPVGDHQAMAQALLRLLHDPDLSRRLAENGKAHFQDHFSVAQYVQGFCDLYDMMPAPDRAAAPQDGGAGDDDTFGHLYAAYVGTTFALERYRAILQEYKGWADSSLEARHHQAAALLQERDLAFHERDLARQERDSARYEAETQQRLLEEHRAQLQALQEEPVWRWWQKFQELRKRLTFR
jgi:hypothetical protein